MLWQCGGGSICWRDYGWEPKAGPPNDLSPSGTRTFAGRIPHLRFPNGRVGYVSPLHWAAQSWAGPSCGMRSEASPMANGSAHLRARPYLMLRIANLRCVAEVFGERAAIEVRREIARRFDDFGGAGVVQSSSDGGPADAVVWQVDGERWLPACIQFAAAPIFFEGNSIHVILAEGSCDTPDVHADRGEAWQARYRNDMALAANLLSHASERGVLPAWQAVHDTRAIDQVLYYECLLRKFGEDGRTASPASGIRALERLGLIRILDRMMVQRVLKELETAPDVELGVNISAQSAVCDFWWLDIISRLASVPAVARRLVLEITETSAPISISAMVRFADEMRGLGCRIALDDFGTGHASIRQLLAIRPDIAKIDASFLRRAQCSARGRTLLGHLVGLAGSVATFVTVEGVESEDQSVLAREAGARWQQGYLFGRPSATRNWSRPFAAREKIENLTCADATIMNDLSSRGHQATFGIWA
jgi:EAL domain-containing protein (putative c-di-GMP-specific phosphodiesterase class I)